MIVELLLMLLTPLAAYHTLRAFNVPRLIAVLISAVYTLLLAVAFVWVMLTYGILFITLAVLIIVLLLRRLIS